MYFKNIKELGYESSLIFMLLECFVIHRQWQSVIRLQVVVAGRRGRHLACLGAASDSGLLPGSCPSSVLGIPPMSPVLKVHVLNL